jgi:xanthine dehydrogenase YagS FAD-binding subunit
MLPNFTYVRPTSLADAVRQLTAPGASVHAGGSDLLGCLRDHVFESTRLVSISGLDALRGIAPAAGGGLRIGALTTLSEVASSKLVSEQYTVLAQAAGAAASPQLRNQGTIGGNLCQRPRCWYFRGDFHCVRKGGDTCYATGGENQYHCLFGGGACLIVHPSDTAPALVALDARVQIMGSGGSRTIPLASFFVLPEKDVTRENVLDRGEIITDILVPPQAPNQRSMYRKVRGRGSWDFALASLALTISMKAGVVERARLVLGGAAPIPWRLETAEKAIVGRKLEPKVIAAAADAALKGAQPLEHNGYKVALFKGVITESLVAMAVEGKGRS